MRTILSQASKQGRRDYQEDRIYLNVNDDGILAAVFDGHGGAETSDYCVKNLLQAFNAVADDPVYPEIRDKLQGIFNHLHEQTCYMQPGSTASIVFIPSSLDRAYIGILGDSPVVIKNVDNEIWIAPEHNVRSNSREVALAKARGGYIHGGYLFPGGLSLTAHGVQLSRAFGDADLNSVLSRKPEIFEVPLGAGSWVLVASDGLIDPHHGSDQAADTIVNLIGQGKTAVGLVDYAIGVPTHDNASAVLVKIIE